MPTVEFKFAVQQKVKTVLGDEGIIDMQGFGGGNIRYYVLFKEGKGSWFDEEQLTAVE
jgi:hypothetical protein